MLQGKKLSVLGDSISSYKGYSDNGRANASTRFNLWFYSPPFPVERTYWMRVANELGLTLCVNNSWSGGNLSGQNDPHSGLNRADQLAKDDGETPDIIILFMGMNDLGRRVDADLFANDYALTLQKIKQTYPSAYICCVSLPDREACVKQRTILFNSKIENAVKNAGENVFIADLFSSKLNNDFYYMNTLDGLHPDEDGMKIIADVVTEAIKKNL